MTIPKINSAHGSDTRNIINSAIDSTNAQGKAIQNLVAKGQLTPTQYATLIQAVNGLISKGDVSVYDIDKNKGKIDQTYLSQSLIDLLTGSPDANILSEVAKNSITRDKIVNKAIGQNKTNFMTTGKNLFNLDEAQVGYTLNVTNGNTAVNATHTTTEYIPVIKGESFAISHPRFILFYDENKAFHYDSANSHGNASGYSPQVANVPITGYMRVATGNSMINEIQIERGGVHTSYEPFVFKVKDSNYVEENQLLPLKDKIDIIEISKNIFNKSNVRTGALLNPSDGAIVENENYNITDYIVVTEGRTYTLSNFRNAILYTENKVWHEAFYGTAEMDNISFKADINGYLRASVRSDLINVAQIEFGEVSTDYEPHYTSIRGLDLKGADNPLQGKSILNMGDSIAIASTAGVVGYNHSIASNNNMAMMDLSSNGATIRVRTQNNNNIVEQVNSAVASNSEFNYIIFNGLTNDVNTLEGNIGEITNGYASALDETTFCGAFEYILKTLKTKFLDAKILYIRPHNMTSRGDNQIILAELAIEICEKWSVPYVDLYKEGGLNTHIPGVVGKFTISDTDATHPNTEGYANFYTPLIDSKLKSL